MQIPTDCETWTKEQWLKEIQKKTTGNFIMGVLIGASFIIAMVALAFYFR